MAFYTDQQVRAKQKSISNRKWGIKIRDLDQAYDLAQLIKHLMVDHKQTYYDTPSKRQQCRSGASRTVEDLTVIANTYGIQISLKDCLTAVSKLYNGYLNHDFCSTVRKQVHDPRKLTITAAEIRDALGKLNVKNPDYVKPKHES